LLESKNDNYDFKKEQGKVENSSKNEFYSHVLDEIQFKKFSLSTKTSIDREIYPSEKLFLH
jgi:hypothetical protein